MKTTKKGTVIALKGLCDYAITKHKLKTSQIVNSSTKEKHKFNVLAVPRNSGFVVSSEKAEAFKNSTNSKEDNEFVRKMAETFRVNNLVEEGPVLKKTIKPSKK